MFNSQSFQKDKIDFVSNPTILEKPKVVPDVDQFGNYCNKVVIEPADNRSPFEGVHFSREQMSLRALLNSGVQLNEVSMPSLYSDPLTPAMKLANLESQVMQRLSELQKQSALSPSASPSPSEPSKSE